MILMAVGIQEDIDDELACVALKNRGGVVDYFGLEMRVQSPWKDRIKRNDDRPICETSPPHLLKPLPGGSKQ